MDMNLQILIGQVLEYIGIIGQQGKYDGISKNGRYKKVD